jgi:hypothetical protein
MLPSSKSLIDPRGYRYNHHPIRSLHACWRTSKDFEKQESKKGPEPWRTNHTLPTASLAAPHINPMKILEEIQLCSRFAAAFSMPGMEASARN